MKITSAKKGTRLTVFFSGELDHHAAGEVMESIEDKLDQAMFRDCVFDLGGVSFMDSSGIAVILKSYRLINASGGRLWIENVPPQAMRVLDASGIDRLVGITADR